MPKKSIAFTDDTVSFLATIILSSGSQKTWVVELFFLEFENEHPNTSGMNINITLLSRLN